LVGTNCKTYRRTPTGPGSTDDSVGFNQSKGEPGAMHRTRRYQRRYRRVDDRDTDGRLRSGRLVQLRPVAPKITHVRVAETVSTGAMTSSLALR